MPLPGPTPRRLLVSDNHNMEQEPDGPGPGRLRRRMLEQPQPRQAGHQALALLQEEGVEGFGVSTAPGWTSSGICRQPGSGPRPSRWRVFTSRFCSTLRWFSSSETMSKEAYCKTGTSVAPRSDALFVAKKEHLFGKKVYCTKAQFRDNGKAHDIAIEFETVGFDNPCLEIRIDKKRVMQVKRLVWKFRGNHTILVDGVPVEVFWDIHNWLFDPADAKAVFMFQTSLSADDKMSPWSCSQAFGEAHRLSFSLVLIAWKNE
ncbi:uncharacterized protein M6B38_344575 [Iris pallida]|uniref:DUF868 domain-containing protein n=1 Tax=Iris pallida TaxID=29817 RepID=A0AAX6GV71_IRIPA|nr:uncharacterized protein M6B38_344575 [Iris pallida]